MSQTAQRFVETVSGYADRVFEQCADKYGADRSMLLVDGIDLKSGEPARWEGAVLSNLACQQNFARTLVGLSALTGEGRYQQRAGEWIGQALRTLRGPASDMLYWGGHSSFDLETSAPLKGNHELKCAYPYYEFLYQVDPEATRCFVEGFWHAHVADWSTLLFNRHGEYEDWDRGRRWKQGRYQGGPLPIVENRLLSFINTGSDLICAGALLHALDGTQEPLLWARRLLGRYAEVRNQETGLGGYQFNHREPCRVRASFKEPLGGRQDVNETTVIGNGVIRTRYGRAAITFLNLCEVLGVEKGRDFFDLAVRDLAALAEHAYDASDRSFSAVLADGARLSPDDAMEVGYCPPTKLQKVPACGLMFLAYAQAYRIAREPHFWEMACSLAEGMGWGQGEGEELRVDFDRGGEVSPDAPEAWANPGQDGVCALFGLLELQRASGQEGLLDGAAALGRKLLENALADGFLRTGTETRDGYTSIDGALPLGLLHLAAAMEGPDVELPQFYPNLSFFDPKIVIRYRQSI